MLNGLKLFLVRLKESFRLTFGKYPNIQQNNLDYDNYWDSKRSTSLGKLTDFQKGRVKIILKHLKDKGSIKDIGCGDGGPLFYLKNNFKFSKCIGADLSDKVLNHLKKEGLDTTYVDLNDMKSVSKLPKTDYTLALEVLEHIPDSEKVLLELLKKTNKTLFFSVPNTGFIAHRKRLLFGSFPLQWRLSPNEHLRFWTLGDMKWWLKQLGLKSQATIVCYEGYPLLNKLWPGMFSMGMVIIINKK